MLVGQFGRMLKRRFHQAPDGETLVEAAPAAALDTVGVAVVGYEDSQAACGSSAFELFAQTKYCPPIGSQRRYFSKGRKAESCRGKKRQ